MPPMAQERCADDFRGGFRVRTDANGYYELRRPEVAQRLGRTLDAVKKVWTRALGRLRRSLKGEP